MILLAEAICQGLQLIKGDKHMAIQLGVELLDRKGQCLRLLYDIV